MSAPRPLVDERARAVVDTIEVPISVTTSVRDRDGRLLDFRLELVNVAAATWAGLDRDAVVGRLATDLLPVLRPSGLFDALERVVSTGRPLRQRGERYEGNVEEGHSFAAAFDLVAVRHGDGYVSGWAERPEEPPSPDELEDLVERARSAVPLVRLEARQRRLRLRPAT